MQQPLKILYNVPLTQAVELLASKHDCFFNVGAEEGKKYMEKTINKHYEIVESIKELSNGLLDLEAKLQVIKTSNIIILLGSLI